VRLLPVLLVGALLGLGVSACGGERHVAGSTHGIPSATSTTSPFTTTTSSVIPPGQALRGDGDADNPSDIDGNGDADGTSAGGTDGDNDNPTRASYDFPDRDDKATFAYGHRPSALDRRAISSLVKRYYAAASRDDGATACSLLISSLASSVSEDYGHGSGSSDTPGGKTCKEVLTMLFGRSREQLAEAITVVEVRVEGNGAQVVFSSRKMPASSISLAREGGSWKLVALLGQPLP
jgi:hypothetical protein